MRSNMALAQQAIQHCKEQAGAKAGSILMR